MDTPTYFLVVLLALLAVLALTVVGFVTAIPVILVGFVTGEFQSTAKIALVAAASWIAAQALSWSFAIWLDSFFLFEKETFHLYQMAFMQNGFGPLVLQWLEFFVVKEVWLRLTPMGLILGAAICFWWGARRDAAAQRVGGGR